MGHCLVLSMDQGWVQALGVGRGSLPVRYLQLVFFSAKLPDLRYNCSIVSPGHSHKPQPHGGFFSGCLLEILCVSVCVFQRLKPRRRPQVPCGREPSASPWQALQNSNGLTAWRLEKVFSSKFQRF